MGHPSAGIEKYYDVILSEKIHASEETLEFVLDNLFGGINFINKRVLDIGGGRGLFSFYAASCGAEKVICVDPESAGGGVGIHAQFIGIQGQLGLSNVRLEPVAFQEYKSDGRPFDVIILHNSINHLDESACIHLMKDERARAVYRSIFFRLAALSKVGTKLIICDCSNFNFYALTGRTNPYAPTIEWHKHQAPEVWVEMLTEAGFADPEIRWKSIDAWGRLGKLLTGNKLMSFFLNSHFCIFMTKD
jgi:SAM-dependent methyltransferase